MEIIQLGSGTQIGGLTLYSHTVVVVFGCWKNVAGFVVFDIVEVKFNVVEKCQKKFYSLSANKKFCNRKT